MDKLHNKGVQSSDKILDDIKKRVGESRKYIDDSVESANEFFKLTSCSYEKTLGELKESIESLKDNISFVSGLTYQAKGAAESNKHRIDSVEKNKEYIDEVYASLRDVEKTSIVSFSTNKEDVDGKLDSINRFIEEISSKVEKNTKNSSALSIELDEVKKFSEILDESTVIDHNQISTIKRACNSQAISCQNLKEGYNDLVERLGVLCSVTEKRLGGLDNKIDDMSNRFDDLKKVSEKITSSSELKQLKEVIGMKENLQTTQKSIKDDIASWKKQIELKITRLENKFYGD